VVVVVEAVERGEARGWRVDVLSLQLEVRLFLAGLQQIRTDR
jgi:hypothetical protein